VVLSRVLLSMCQPDMVGADLVKFVTHSINHAVTDMTIFGVAPSTPFPPAPTSGLCRRFRAGPTCLPVTPHPPTDGRPAHHLGMAFASALPTTSHCTFPCRATWGPFAGASTPPPRRPPTPGQVGGLLHSASTLIYTPGDCHPAASLPRYVRFTRLHLPCHHHTPPALCACLYLSCHTIYPCWAGGACGGPLHPGPAIATTVCAAFALSILLTCLSRPTAACHIRPACLTSCPSLPSVGYGTLV